MAARHGEITVTVDRPVETVFDFLAHGENDKLFSQRIIEISRTKDSPDGVGTVYRSKAKDFGLTAWHEFEITAFERPSRIEWRELTKGPVVVQAGGYRMRAIDAGHTELTFWGDLAGRGLGVLLVGFISKRVRASFPEFAQAMKATIEKHVAP